MITIPILTVELVAAEERKEGNPMKKLISLILCLCLMAGIVPVMAENAVEGSDYTVQTTGVWDKQEQVGSMDLRFYAAAPHVPYYGMKAYVAFMRNVDLTVTPKDGGIWEVANPNGSSLLVNPSAGTIDAADWAKFQLPPTPYTNMTGIKDSPCAWTYYSEVLFDDPPTAVSFDFAKYGIGIYADADDVYLPLAMLSTMFVDVALNYVLWDGEKVLRPALDMDALGSLPAEFFEGEHMKALLTGEKQREEDVIREDYAELCLALDYFFGHPGTAKLDASIGEKGLDAALDDDPELKERLMNPNMVEYLLGMFDLFNIDLDDGHTYYCTIVNCLRATFQYPEITQQMASGIASYFNTSSLARGQMMQSIKTTRSDLWGDDLYRECGSTAIIRIDSFNWDKDGWEAYYAGKGEIPMDAVGITWTNLKKASENPAIKNILFDFTANGGGSSDMLMFMMDLMFGEKNFYGYNPLTKQHMHAIVHSDKNLDGVIDEKDEEVKYDFNYAVLTTRASFSCGNLFPFVMQDHGAVLIGEPTGGGSCSVQMSVLTGGGGYFMSSGNWTLQNAAGDSVEGGCKTDLPIERIEPETPTNANPRLSVGDYTPYFDDVMLDRMINEWFEAQAEKPAA